MEIEYLEKAIGRKLEWRSLEEIINERKIGYALDEKEKIIAVGLFGFILKDYTFLSDLKNITTLYLRHNQISDISFISKLKNLTTLDLGFNQISDYSFLSDLKNLTKLDLSFNQITDISFISDLKSLTTLGLGSNQISDYIFRHEELR